MSVLKSTTILERLSRLAQKEGWVAVAVAPALPSPSREILQKVWIRRGYMATMSWMLRTLSQRIHPQSLLPGAQRVVVFLTTYRPSPETSSSIPSGKIAHYAQYRDYHTIMKKRLKRVWEQFTQTLPPAQHRFFVDTGALMERDYAAMAGLGYRAKNTLLIHPQWGSYTLIGAILTDLPLPLSPRPRWFHINHKALGNRQTHIDDPESLFTLCGTCHRCIQACPTGALKSPGILDASRCISYHTIENRAGEIPESLRPHLSGYLFGCDICQDVCPWNTRLVPKEAPLLGPSRHPPTLPLEEASTMDEHTFRKRFAGSPLRRIRAEILRRNAALAWVHWAKRFPDQTPVVRRTLYTLLKREPSPLVRRHLRWSLWYLHHWP